MNAVFKLTAVLLVIVLAAGLAWSISGQGNRGYALNLGGHWLNVDLVDKPTTTLKSTFSVDKKVKAFDEWYNLGKYEVKSRYQGLYLFVHWPKNTKRQALDVTISVAKKALPKIKQSEKMYVPTSPGMGKVVRHTRSTMEGCTTDNYLYEIKGEHIFLQVYTDVPAQKKPVMPGEFKEVVKRLMIHEEVR